MSGRRANLKESDDVTHSPREMIETLVGFPTVSRDSNLDLIHFVRDYLAGCGVESRIVPNEDATKANLYATIGPDVEGGVVLSGHTRRGADRWAAVGYRPVRGRRARWPAPRSWDLGHEELLRDRTGSGPRHARARAETPDSFRPRPTTRRWAASVRPR